MPDRSSRNPSTGPGSTAPESTDLAELMRASLRARAGDDSSGTGPAPHTRGKGKVGRGRGGNQVRQYAFRRS
jgi:hypothetical protein